jgi:hypothetical protein
LLFSSRAISQSGTLSDEQVIANVDSALGRLVRDDYEYMVWVAWKEGFARYIENRIRRRYGLEPNLGGREQPFDRVTFYNGGEKLITYLAAQRGGKFPDVRELFGEMFALPEGK